MSAKEYLNRVRVLNVVINNRFMQLRELEEMKTAIGSPMRDDPVQTSKSGEAPYVRMAESIADLEQEIRELIYRYTLEKSKIIAEIGALTRPEYVELLMRRYVRFERLEQIAYELSYSYDHTRKMHGAALRAFEELFPESRKRAGQ